MGNHCEDTRIMRDMYVHNYLLDVPSDFYKHKNTTVLKVLQKQMHNMSLLSYLSSYLPLNSISYTYKPHLKNMTMKSENPNMFIVSFINHIWLDKTWILASRCMTLTNCCLRWFNFFPTIKDISQMII